MKEIKTINLLSLLLFLVNTILVLFNKTYIIDQTIYNYLIKIKNPFFDNFFCLITKLGNTIPILIILIILIIKIKGRNKILLATNIIMTVISNQVLKHIIRRLRPSNIFLIKQGGFSYPSGHAMISIAVYGFLIYYFYNLIEDKTKKIKVIIPIIILILLIGISRIYVGVHYFSDILGGYLLASAILLYNITDFSEE